MFLYFSSPVQNLSLQTRKVDILPSLNWSPLLHIHAGMNGCQLPTMAASFVLRALCFSTSSQLHLIQILFWFLSFVFDLQLLHWIYILQPKQTTKLQVWVKFVFIWEMHVLISFFPYTQIDFVYFVHVLSSFLALGLGSTYFSDKSKAELGCAAGPYNNTK